MTDRELMQMALDALEHGLPIIEDFGDKEQLQLQHKAIAALYEALRARLEQRESVTQFSFQEYGPPNWGDSQVTKPEFVAEQKAMKEALMKRVVDGIPDMPIKVQDEREENYKNFAQSAQVIGIPQREWVGLTDEEYEAIREDGQFGKGSIRFKNLFEAIEAKLKEKNT